MYATYDVRCTKYKKLKNIVVRTSNIIYPMTIFSKIIAGEIPSYKIAENEKFFAFLDIFPLVKGHVLVVPKIEVDKLFDVPDNYLAELLVFAKPIAHAIEKSFDCNRCGVSVIGIEVPHAHVHLMPINNANDINFTRSKLKLSTEEMKEIQQMIIAQLV
jgi:histidine triad (HIT) family protein